MSSISATNDVGKKASLNPGILPIRYHRNNEQVDFERKKKSFYEIMSKNENFSADENTCCELNRSRESNKVNVTFTSKSYEIKSVVLTLSRVLLTLSLLNDLNDEYCGGRRSRPDYGHRDDDGGLPAVKGPLAKVLGEEVGGAHGGG